MSDQVYEVPLLELMARVPPKAILRWTDTEGLQASHSVPVGKYLHAAIGCIREQEGSIVALKARCRELQGKYDQAASIIAEIVALAPLSETLAVAKTGKTLVDWLKSKLTPPETFAEQRNQAKAAPDTKSDSGSAAPTPRGSLPNSLGAIKEACSHPPYAMFGVNKDYCMLCGATVANRSGKP